jgi:hypothetical protein
LRRKTARENAWGDSGRDARTLAKFRRLLSKAKEDDRLLLLSIAYKMARKNSD